MEVRRVIDPTQTIAGSEEATLLGALLSGSRRPLFYHDEPYTVAVNNKQVTFWLEYPILRRQRLNKKKINGWRYEVLGSVIATGGYATIMDSLRTLKVENGKVEICNRQKKRVVKYQNHAQQAARLGVNVVSLQPLIANENIHSLRAQHLHAKPIVCVHNEDGVTLESLLVMRKFEGANLGDLIQNDAILRSWLRPFAKQITSHISREACRLLSLEERLQICINVLRALGTQVRAQDDVHFDLKPDNIVVDNNKNIKIIDFCGATDAGGVRLNVFVASRAYLAPEANVDHARYNSALISTESDTYSIGMLLKNLWGDNSFMFDRAQPVYLEDLERGLKLLKFQGDREKVLNILHSLTHEDIQQRSSVEEAIQVFENILWQHKYLQGAIDRGLTVEKFKLAYKAEYNNTCRFFRNPFSTMLNKLKCEQTSPKTIAELEAYALKNKSSRTAKVINKIR